MSPLAHQEQVYHGIPPAEEQADETLQQDHTGGISGIPRRVPAPLAGVRGRTRVRLQYPGKPLDVTTAVRPGTIPTTGPVTGERERDPATSLPPHLEKERFLEHIRRLMSPTIPKWLGAQRRYKDD